MTVPPSRELLPLGTEFLLEPLFRPLDMMIRRTKDQFDIFGVGVSEGQHKLLMVASASGSAHLRLLSVPPPPPPPPPPPLLLPLLLLAAAAAPPPLKHNAFIPSRNNQRCTRSVHVEFGERLHSRSVLRLHAFIGGEAGNTLGELQNNMAGTVSYFFPPSRPGPGRSSSAIVAPEADWHGSRIWQAFTLCGAQGGSVHAVRPACPAPCPC